MEGNILDGEDDNENTDMNLRRLQDSINSNNKQITELHETRNYNLRSKKVYSSALLTLGLGEI
jgi:hypothetical protein